LLHGRLEALVQPIKALVHRAAVAVAAAMARGSRMVVVGWWLMVLVRSCWKSG
jgi:hypothetical protein